MLTPADIDTKRFSTTRLKEGYVQEEVDDFLDRVQEDYRFLDAQCKRLGVENELLKRKAALASEAPTSHLPVIAAPTAVAEKLLAVAEQAAAEHEAEGRAKADELVREAGARGARIVEDATAAAERIKSDGLAEKYRRVEELDKRATELNTIIGDLNSRGVEVKQALTRALNEVSEL